MIEWLPNDVNQKNTQEYTWIKENMSEINDIRGFFPINNKPI